MSEQIRVTVITKQNKEGIELLHDTENSLLHTIREGGIVLPSLCNSMGKCGRCRVRFSGYAPLPVQADRIAFSPDMLREGYRLACMSRPMRDCIVETAFAEDKTMNVLTVSDTAEIIQEQDKQGSVLPCRTTVNGKSGETVVAADIGTTTIAMQLIETASGRIADIYTALNPQRSYGMDVISRIKVCSEGKAEVLRQQVESVLASGLEFFEESVKTKGLCKPRRMVIACNTAMGHIFMGYDTEQLGRSPFMPVNIRAVETEWKGMPTMLMPGISAFIGGDIIAGLYACGLCPVQQEDRGAWLFLDLGTNAEMVIGAGERVLCTAAAAGPAFEGCGRDGALAAERIAAIAQLLDRGIIDETGLLTESYFETGIEVELTAESGENDRASGTTRVMREKAGKRKLHITQEDIRDIQMAKAAVRTGIYFLMENMGIQRYELIENVFIAGGFGFYLQPPAAVRCGLLPEELEAKIKTVGNTSLAGAAALGRKMAEDSKLEGKQIEIIEILEQYAHQAEVFNLAQMPEFEKMYVDYINF